MIEYIFYFIVLQFVLIYPSFFFYKKMLEKFNVKYLKTKAYLLTLILPIVYTIFFSIICVNVVDPYIRAKKFESSEWKDDVHNRYQMMNDIIDNSLFIGKSKDEIISILGSDYESDGPCNGCIGYSVYDPDNFMFSIDHEVLAIYFNKDHRVINVEKGLW